MSLMVSSASNLTNNRTTDMSVSLKKAIKDYQDELYTGLTEDERKEIEAKINEFVKERTKDKNYDKEAFRAELDSFIKSLLKEYGFKGGDSFEDILSLSSGNSADITSPEAGSVTSTNSAADILMNMNSSTGSVTDSIKTSCYMTSDSDGSAHLLITTPNGIFMKIAMGTGQEVNDSQIPINNAVSDYEKNMEYFFDENNSVSFRS